MNTGAGVRSLEALKDWYSALAEFRGDAQNALVTLAMAVQHAHDWLADQQAHWQRAIREAEDEVAHARIELARLRQQRFFGDRPDTTVAEQILRKTQAELEFCEERLESVRRWKVKLPEVTQDTYDGPARRLEFFLEADFVRALALLDRQLGALEQYVNLQAAPRPAGPPASSTGETAPTKEQS